MRARNAAAAILVVLAFGAAACSSGEETPSLTGSTAQTGSPSSEPPWGLDTIDMPDDAQAVQAKNAVN